MSRPAPDRPGLPRPQADPGAGVDTAPVRCCRIAASLPGLSRKYPPGPPPGTPSCFKQSSEPTRAAAPGLPNGSGSRPLPWSQARAVNCAVPRLVQHTGVTRFSLVKPQCWAAASHVILCWLALLLIRIAETTAGATWAAITDELDLLTLGTFTGPVGTFRQTAELTKTQRDLLAKLKITHPKKIIEVTPASA